MMSADEVTGYTALWIKTHACAMIVKSTQNASSKPIALVRFSPSIYANFHDPSVLGYC